MTGQQQQVPHAQQQTQVMQHQKQHRIDELLDMLQQPTLTPAEADAAEEELEQLFSSNSPANEPTQTHVQALVSLLTSKSPTAATSAACILQSLSGSNPTMISQYLQQDLSLSALANLLQNTSVAASAALHLLLALAGQTADNHFEAPPVNSTVPLQRIMSHPRILSGLVHQLTGGEDSASAAALMLARWTVSSPSAGFTPAQANHLAAQMTRNHDALACTANLLRQRGEHIHLADAAAQLLHTVLQTAPEAAQSATDLAGDWLVALLAASSKEPQTATQQQQSATALAGQRAAAALCSMFQASNCSKDRGISCVQFIPELALLASQQGDTGVQERAVQVLLAAAIEGTPGLCKIMGKQPALARGLLPMLPGGARPVQAAQALASRLISDMVPAKQLAIDLFNELLLPADQAAPAQSASVAAEQAVWVLTTLVDSRRRSITAAKYTPQVIRDAIEALLHDGANKARQGVIREMVASRLCRLILQQGVGGGSWVQQAASAAAAELLHLMVALASLEVRASLAAALAGDLLHAFAHCVAQQEQHSGSASGSQQPCSATSASVSKVFMLLADASKQQPAPSSTADVACAASSSTQGWLADNCSALEQVAASCWGSLSVRQLAAVAKMARQAQLQQHVQHRGSAPAPAPVTVPAAAASARPPLPPPAAEAAAAAEAASKSPADPSGALQMSKQQGPAATCKAPTPKRPTNTNRRGADQQGPAAAAGTRLLAGQTATPSNTPHSAAFAALSANTQRHIMEQCGAIPPDQHLAAWQVTVQPFDAQQLQALCATYMRCNFAGESWEPEVRSKELVPQLQQLHTQAKAEQQAPPTQGAPASASASTSSSAAALIQASPAAVKLLRALRLLQHWDIVCPTQPGMPEPLRKMMLQAGCAAAAGSACDDDDEDDVQVVDTEPAAEVDDDIEAQLQHLEDGDCDMVLTKYVPGRHEQPDVQLVDQPPPAPHALQQEAPAVPPAAAPVHRPRQQQQQQGPDQQVVQAAAQPAVEEELPLRMRTRAAKPRRHD
jgi:hypothetical protein